MHYAPVICDVRRSASSSGFYRFVAAGLALFGVLVPFDWWRILAIASAVVSLLLLVIFWDPYLIVGLLIDAAVLVTLISTDWSPE